MPKYLEAEETSSICSFSCTVIYKVLGYFNNTWVVLGYHMFYLKMT